MKIRRFEDLPEKMQNESVAKYHRVLKRRKISLAMKRVMDIIAALVLLVLLAPVMLGAALAIKLDSRGTTFFRQTRVTQYGRLFKIFKFRTMVSNAEALGTQVTTHNDARVTRVGKLLRQYRLDEIPQLINILTGDMTLVGTRPEVPKYVRHYTGEMMATLLLPAGVTSAASILYKDEEKLLVDSENADETYINEIMPEKLRHNLAYFHTFSFFHDIRIIFATIIAMGKK